MRKRKEEAVGLHVRRSCGGIDTMLKRIAILWVWVGAVSLWAGPWSDAVDRLGLTEVAATFAPEKTKRVLGDAVMIQEIGEQQAAALLVSIGVVSLDDFSGGADPLAAWGEPTERPDGPVEYPFDDMSALLRLAHLGGHEALREDEALLASLDEAVRAGVLTGYGLRPIGVSAGTDAGRTVIYSHSSWPHMKQLVALVASEGFEGRVMIAPKVSAFVFREGWGEPPPWVRELGPGLRVAQGPEWLVHFEFDDVHERQRFDALVERYAKRDTEDETGLLLRAWWQPFYYCETPARGYPRIARLTLNGDEIEVSLLMLPERLDLVAAHFAESPWRTVPDSIWVSPAFHRFLLGDYR